MHRHIPPSLLLCCASVSSSDSFDSQAVSLAHLRPLPAMSSDPVPVCATPLQQCPFCAAAPPLHMQPSSCLAWGLSYAQGLQKLRVQKSTCTLCGWSFTGCWAVPPCGTARVRIACHPSDSEWFLFRERLHANSFVALHSEYLRFMTISFLFLRASFAGLAKTIEAMFPSHSFGPNDCLRGLEHGWFLHSCLVAAWSPCFLGTDFDLRLEYLDQTLSSYEAALHETLHRHAASHHCPSCANPVIAGDGGMKLTTRLCNERTSAKFSCDALDMSLVVGCNRRPRNGSLFCHLHHIPASGTLPPEIRDHKFIQGVLHFRYQGSSDFVPVTEVHLARLRQYDSNLCLIDYGACDPHRFARTPPLQEPYASGLWFSTLSAKFSWFFPFYFSRCC